MDDDGIYRCLRCGRTFKFKGALTNHEKRKKPCRKPSEKDSHKPPKKIFKRKNTIEIGHGKILYDGKKDIYICSFCGKTFAYRTNVYRHFKICEIKVHGDEKYTAIEQEVERLKRENEKLKRQSGDKKTIINNTYNNTININIYKDGINFHDERIKIEEKDIPKISKIEKNYLEGAKQITKHIYCNPDVPQRLVVSRPDADPNIESYMLYIDCGKSMKFFPTTEKDVLRVIFGTICEVNKQLHDIDNGNYDDKKFKDANDKFLSIIDLLHDKQNRIDYDIFRHSGLIQDIMTLLYKNMELIKEKCGVDLYTINEYGHKSFLCEFKKELRKSSEIELLKKQDEKYIIRLTSNEPLLE